MNWFRKQEQPVVNIAIDEATTRMVLNNQDGLISEIIALHRQAEELRVEAFKREQYVQNLEERNTDLELENAELKKRVKELKKPKEFVEMLSEMFYAVSQCGRISEVMVSHSVKLRLVTSDLRQCHEPENLRPTKLESGRIGAFMGVPMYEVYDGTQLAFVTKQGEK